MDLITVRELYKHPKEYFDKKVQTGGWIHGLCDSKFSGFIMISDGSYFETLQVVYRDDPSNFTEVSKLNVGITIIVKGTLVATPDAKQPLKIQTVEVAVEGTSAPDYPLQKKRHSFKYLHSVPHLRPRTNTFRTVFHVRSLITYVIHQYFQERDFAYVHTPLITGSDCEGAGKMFQVTTLDLDSIPRTDDGKVDSSRDFFNKPTNLTVNGQLDAKTYAMASHNVYIFGPTFHAEDSNTAHHTAEFWMIEPEMAFTDLDDNMHLAEGMLKYIIKHVLEHAPEEMNFFNQFVDKGLLECLDNVLNAEFEHITYTDAAGLLEKHNDEFNYEVSQGYDLQTEHERYLTEKIFKRPVFITDYPKKIKAFCMRMSPDNKTVAAVDCSIPGIDEIIGGSQRKDNLEKLVAKMDELDLNKDDYGFCPDLRKYGFTRHAGFGLGFGHCVIYLTGMDNIRDMIPPPGTVNNYEL